MRAAFFNTLLRSGRGRRADPPGGGRPRVRCRRAVRPALSRPILECRRRRAEHDRRRRRPRAVREDRVHVLDRELLDDPLSRADSQRHLLSPEPTSRSSPVGGGFAYGPLGMTHHAVEDLAIMRVLPGMVVVAPGDPFEVEQATRAIVAQPGPCYLRLRPGRRAQAPWTGRPCSSSDAAIRVREGRALTIISSGGLLETALRAAELLSEAGIDARVVSMHTLKPLDEVEVLSAARGDRRDRHPGGAQRDRRPRQRRRRGPRRVEAGRGRLKRLGMFHRRSLRRSAARSTSRAMHGLPPAAVFESLKSWLWRRRVALTVSRPVRGSAGALPAAQGRDRRRVHTTRWPEATSSSASSSGTSSSTSRSSWAPGMRWA